MLTCEAEWSTIYPVHNFLNFFMFWPRHFNSSMSVTIEGGILWVKKKLLKLKKNDVTYIVSEVNRNDDYLKQIIKDMLIEILKYEQKK